MSQENTSVETKTWIEKLVEKKLANARPYEFLKFGNDFCVKHEDFVYCNEGGWAQRKPWAAQIKGLHPQYKFEREFLDRKRIDNVVYQILPSLPAVIEFHGGSTKHDYRVFYLLFMYGERLHAALLKESELLEALS